VNHSLDQLQDRIGYHFEAPEHLLEALSHSSYAHENGGPDNERLEFLGDAVLQASSTMLLMDRFPDAREGVLSRLRSRIVSTTALAVLGRELELGSYLRLGVGEKSTGGELRDSNIACAMEAVLGAIHRDAGFDAAFRTIEALFASRIDELQAEGARTGWKDPRSLLQELTQDRVKLAPKYTIIANGGPAHAPEFTVEVRVGKRLLGTGRGGSKRSASRAAAEVALTTLGTEDA